MFPGSESHDVYANLKWILYRNNLCISEALQIDMQAANVESTGTL